MNKVLLKKYLIGDFTFKRLVKSVLFIYFFFFIFGYFFPDYLIFRPPPSSYENIQDGRELITKEGNKIYSVYLKNNSAKFTILYFHGNAEDLGQTLPILEEYRDKGFSIFSYDYRGYGLSTGRPKERDLYKDLYFVYDYMTTTLNISPNRLIIHGRSVGGGLATELASKKLCAGLILESSFVSAFRVLTRISIYPFDMYNNIEKIKQVKFPVLIIHGKKDGIISFWHGKKLFEEANNPKKYIWVDEAGHNDLLYIAGDDYWKAVINFIND